MGAPPFDVIDAASQAEACERSRAGAQTGNTLSKLPRPVAELLIRYQVQFRFNRFWDIVNPTPCWDGGVDAADLPEALANSAPETLDAKDRVVQFNYDDQATVKMGKDTVSLALGESKGKSKRIWFPFGKTLPAPLQLKTPGWKWRSPARNTDCPPNQWGLRGELTFRKDPYGQCGVPKTYAMVTVWQRWEYGKLAGKKIYGDDMCTLPPGVYAGYVRVMGNHAGTEEERGKYPAIWVGYEWDPTPPSEDAAPDPPPAKGKTPAVEGPWKKGVLGWKLKNPNATTRTTSVFVHPGNFPQWFLGCIGPGPMNKRAEWGISDYDYSAKTMWEILAEVGVTKSAFVNNYVDPGEKLQKWFLIRVEAASAEVLASDGWKKQRIWID